MSVLKVTHHVVIIILDDILVDPVYNRDHTQKYDKYSPFMATRGKNATVYLYKLHNIICLYGRQMLHLTGISKAEFNSEGNVVTMGDDSDGKFSFPMKTILKSIDENERKKMEMTNQIPIIKIKK